MAWLPFQKYKKKLYFQNDSVKIFAEVENKASQLTLKLLRNINFLLKAVGKKISLYMQILEVKLS